MAIADTTGFNAVMSVVARLIIVLIVVLYVLPVAFLGTLIWFDAAANTTHGEQFSWKSFYEVAMDDTYSDVVHALGEPIRVAGQAPVGNGIATSDIEGSITAYYTGRKVNSHYYIASIKFETAENSDLLVKNKEVFFYFD